MRGCILIVLVAAALGSASKVDFAKLPAQFNHFLETKIKTPEFEGVLDLIRQKKIKPYSSKSDMYDMKLFDGMDDDSIAKADCALCASIVDTYFSWVDAGDSRDEIIRKYTDLCIELNLSSPYVCRTAAEQKVDVAVFIYKSKKDTWNPLTASDVCMFDHFKTCWVDNPKFDWELDLSPYGAKPTPIKPQLPAAGSPTLRVLHFTDLHLDSSYKPGNNANCGEELCCRTEHGLAPNKGDEAGYWGDYRDCDMPYHSFENLVEQASSHNDIDYVLFTGDVYDHGDVNTTQAAKKAATIYALTLFREKFPNLKVFPVLGNHAPHPKNIFSFDSPDIPTEISTNWLYSFVNDVWSWWIPNANETILKGGFYSYELYPGLKVIGLNTLFCYNNNWWLMYDNVDPSGQLAWLAQELSASEQKGQKVHILTHVAGSTKCMPFWQKQFLRLLDRFENTVSAMFYGHTHQEQFAVYYDPNDSERPTQVSFVGGSVTPYSNVNPNYRIYEVDGDYQGSTYRVLDYETWSYNLTEANLGGPSVLPNWRKLYNFKDTFRVYSLFPEDMDAFVKRMIIDDDLTKLYYRYYWTDSDFVVVDPCGSNCRPELICETVMTVQQDTSKCDELGIPIKRSAKRND
ncbi:sphingomyelin phosphodiesterase-like [Neocloeon triangulifer]|uniref:sphingomyelin phosphodiesterase-like n=1 Tax=Neocloeon triangulifer TaxID=2078957 RepID=UPI00286EFFB1|nr:sphingomyelin phosphodiesterase-like [Neocloeon triangulifer]